MTVRIGDPQFTHKLAAILGIPRGGGPYPQDVGEIGIVIAIDGGQVLAAANRLSLSDIAAEAIESDGETTLINIAQNATATQLNLDLGAGINVGETFDLLGYDLWMKLNTFAAGDRAEGLYAFETAIRGAFPVTGARNVGQLRRGRFWVAIDTDELVDIVHIVLPAPYRMKKVSTTVNNPQVHFQVTNRKAAAGNVDVTIGGAVYFRPIL